MSWNHTHSWVVVLQPEVEARGTLVYVPIVCSFYITPYASFTCLISTLNPPPPSFQSPPSPCRLPSLNTSINTPYPPALGLGISHPATTTTVTPVLLSAVPPPGIAAVSDELQYNGQWCSGSRGHMSLPRLALPPPLVHLEAIITTATPCLALTAFLPDGGPPYGGIRWGSPLSWGSSPRSPIQAGGSPELPPCKKCRRYRVSPLLPQNPGENDH